MVGIQSLILQAKIPEEISLKGEPCAHIHIGIAGAEKHGRFFQGRRRRRIQGGIEPIDRAFELTGDPVVIDGRCKDQHLRILQLRVDRVHVVPLGALALPFPMTALTGEAALDVHPAHIEYANKMTVLFRCFPERGDHPRRIPLRSGASVENEYFHCGILLTFVPRSRGSSYCTLRSRGFQVLHRARSVHTRVRLPDPGHTVSCPDLSAPGSLERFLS